MSVAKCDVTSHSRPMSQTGSPVPGALAGPVQATALVVGLGVHFPSPYCCAPLQWH